MLFPAKRGCYCGSLRENARSPFIRSDIGPGGTFPDYELPDHTQTLRRLSELQGFDPLILRLARAHYYWKEHQQHLELAASAPDRLTNARM